LQVVEFGESLRFKAKLTAAANDILTNPPLAGLKIPLAEVFEEDYHPIDSMRTKISAILTSLPQEGYLAFPPGVRLLSAAEDRDTIVVDFSRELSALRKCSSLEDAPHEIIVQPNDELSVVPSEFSRGRNIDSLLRIEGLSLERILGD
jgi:hypothetical protein